MASDRSIVPLYEEERQSPLEEPDHARLLQTAIDWFNASDRKRKPHVEEWRKFYALYRMHVPPRRSGEWRSRVFIPLSFHVIETEMPKLVAQLPAPIVLPVGPEDVEPAAKMEERLKWAFDQAELWVQLVAAYRSALKYGTGILKVYPGKREGWKLSSRPTYEDVVPEVAAAPVPITNPETGEIEEDLDGNPMYESAPAPEPEQVQTGVEQVRESFAYYQGPIAEQIDIEDFWVAPEASSIEDARYVIHRVWRDVEYVKQKIEEGAYTLPAGHSLDSLWEIEESPAAERQGEIGLSSELDPDKRAVEVLEFWSNDELMTVLNQRLVVRVAESPFAHGRKPFVRILDHFQENEFYGVGELGPIAGIQDAVNALWNSRIDQVRLALQRVFAVNPDHLYDLRDLRMAPGKAIRIRGGQGISPSELLFPIETPDVTASAYEEVQALIDMVERVLAVDAYTAGTDSPTLNDTATGIALISEQGNSRFAFKVTMGELTGLVPLARMFGSLLQQYSPPELMIRREGPEGGFEFDPVSSADIQGALDYSIETGSLTQTESIRKEQDASLFQMLQGRTDAAGIPLVNDRELLKDFLRSWGKKDVDRLMVDPTTYQAQQQQALAGLGLEGGEGVLGGGLGMAPPPSAEETAEGGMVA